MTRKVFVIINVCLFALLAFGAVAHAAKTAPPRRLVATAAGRLEVVADPGDSLYPLELTGFIEPPVIVCSLAQEQVGVACQSLSATSGGIWIRNPYDGQVPVIVNWIAQGN